MKSGLPGSGSVPSLAPRAVLLVDDEPQALKWFARSFGDEFDVRTAGSVRQALELLDRQGHEVAVLLTDYRMPERDGVALLAEVRERHPQVSRLLMSAYADKDVAMAAINLGHVGKILEKPLDEPTTRRALREALEVCQQRLREQTLLHRRDEALRETLGFLAHEVGTPLATVSGYLHAMRERQRPSACGNSDHACLSQRRPGEIGSMLDAALRRTDYAQSLVATFVRTARDAYQADGIASGLASDLVRSVREGYPFDGDEASWLTCEVRQDFTLPGQRDLLYLVLCTLVKNALQALHTALPAEPWIRVTIAGTADRAVIEVGDNGPGIAPEMLARLTREPVNTRAGSGGSGMGLIFCQRVMASVGGSVEVRSAPGRGASVRLHFGVRDAEHIHEVSR